MASNQDQVAQFIQVAGVDVNTAQFYLSMANNDLDAAIQHYYDNGPAPAAARPTAISGQASLVPRMVSGVPTSPKSPSSPGSPPGLPVPPARSSAPRPTSSAPPSAASRSAASSTNRGPSQRGGIHTLSSVGSANDGPERDDSDEEHQAYYAGGGERSGVQQLDPNKRPKARADEMTEEVFNRAREMGAKSVEEFRAEQEREKSKFSGSGFRLGSTNAPSLAVKDPQAAQNSPERDIMLTFYEDGFTVDKGPLRKYDHPDNASFLNELNRGIVPQEIRSTDPNERVNINLVDRKREKYTPPPKKFEAFTGNSRTLGSSSSVQSEPRISPTTQQQPQHTPSFEVKSDEPTTTIQIRLHDGTRLIAKFNQHRHTVGDLRRFIAMSRSIPAGTRWNIMTSFPRKTLTDDSLTIKDAQLENSVVMTQLG